jgi:leucine dehydrogenase
MGAASLQSYRRGTDDSTLIVEDITVSAARHPDYAGHETVLLGRDDERGLTAIIAIHSTHLGPAIGGTRVWPHRSFDVGLTDVLRLSHGMTLKAAIAGVPHGGGKAVILADPKRGKSPALFQAYAEMLSAVRDRYYTAEDVGLSLADADFLRRLTPNVLGTTIGGSLNPSPVTALGVYLGILAAVRHRFGRDGIEGMRIAVQGLGAVGAEVARRLHEDGARLTVADIDLGRLQKARDDWNAEVLAADMIAAADADVFVPCALGGALSRQSIPTIRARVVAGAANNQLQTTEDGERLRAAGILYAPDYVINGAGLMNVAAELVPGGYDREAVISMVDRIPDQLTTIFRRADAEGRSTEAVAAAIAAERLA